MLSAETLQARRELQDIFKVLKGKNLQPRLLYKARIPFKMDGEIKSFSDKQKLREFSTTKPVLQQMLNGNIWSKNTREEKRSTKSTSTNINNYFKCKWTKYSNQKTYWLNGHQNKTHIYAVYKQPTSDLKIRIDLK